MAFGTQEKVLFYLGLDAVSTDYFTANNITLAIADADIWVDETNSDASSANKIAASSAYAAGQMRLTKSLADLNGMSSLGQVQGAPASTLARGNQLKSMAQDLLKRTISSRSDADV